MEKPGRVDKHLRVHPYPHREDSRLTEAPEGLDMNVSNTTVQGHSNDLKLFLWMSGETA